MKKAHLVGDPWWDGRYRAEWLVQAAAGVFAVLVIHGIWAYGALSLWAEDSAGPASVPPRPGRPSRAPRPHPFAGGLDALADAIAELAGPAADLARKAIEDELTLRLPSAADGPLASPGLIREPDAVSARRTGLAPWRVPALTFDPATAADLLAPLGEPATGSSAAVPGGSVLYLAALARLADDLVARGRVLPALVASEDGRYAARWRAVLSGADAQRARDLAAAMPPLCRAHAGSEPAAVLVTDALDALADAAARARLGRDPGFALLPARRGRHPARVPVAERWAAALAGADAQVPVATPQDEAEAAELAAALDDWRAAAQVPAGPVRTCFRLTEPEADDPGTLAASAASDSSDDPDAPDSADAPDTWTVGFALQSTDDPSLLLPAADIWSGATAGGWAAAGIRHPEEDLLAGLGTASRLFPELDQGLRSAAPVAVTLDTEGAARFLSQTGPLLAGAGFGVLLPDWAGGSRKRLGLKITTRTRNTAGGGSAAKPRFGMTDLVDFRYDLAVGDEALDPEELEELARLKVPLIRLRGQWVELDDRHLQAALKFLQQRRPGPRRPRRPCATGWPAWTMTCPWWAWTPTAGSATCYPARPTVGSRRSPPRPRSTGNCAPTRNAAWPGCPSSAASASARFSPTIWDWVRAPRRWPCWPARRARPPGRLCWCARCRWSGTGSGRPRGSLPT